jgi:hypothetical protein
VKAESNQAYDAVETRFAGPWLIPDPEYLSFVERLFADAGRRCLVSIFLVGNAPGRDQEPLVAGVLRSLASALRRGVDARLLIGGPAASEPVARLAAAAKKRAAALHVPCRWATEIPKVGGSAKVIISDEYVLVGSQPWSGTPANEPGQDAVCVSSTSLSRRLTDRFENQWLGATSAG